jgi:hypothetical protein
MTETQMGLARFENWQRWACGGEVAIIMAHYYPPKSAMAGQHVSSEVWDEEDKPMPIDERDAQIVERMIVRLPCHLCNAVRYRYVGRPRIIGVPRQVIDNLVEQAAREIMAKRFHVVP